MQATREKVDPNSHIVENDFAGTVYDQMETGLNYIAKLNYVYILVL